MDVSDVVATLTSGLASVSAIGVAALSLVVVIKLYKYVRSAI